MHRGKFLNRVRRLPEACLTLLLLLVLVVDARRSRRRPRAAPPRTNSAVNIANDPRFQRLLRKCTPSTPTVNYNTLCEIADRSHEIERKRACFQAATQLSPLTPYAWVALAQSEVDEGNTLAGVRVLEECRKVGVSSSAVLNNLGNYYRFVVFVRY